MVSEQGSRMKLSSVCQLAPFTSLLAVAQLVAVLARDDVDLGAFRRAGELQALHRRAELRHGVAKCRRRERLVADAQHEIAVQHVQQGRLRRRIGQAVEIEAAHRSGHVAAELLGLKTHGVTPGRHDNVRADPTKVTRGTR